MRFLFVLLALALTAMASGDIVMFGDSTTAPRPRAVEKVYAQRVSEALPGCEVRNAGIGGNNTGHARARLAKDVLAHRPRVVVIQFGINDAAVDVWKTPPADGPRVAPDAYEANLRWIIGEVRTHGAKPVLMTTNPLRWTAKMKQMYGRAPYLPDEVDGFDRPMLARYNETIRRLSAELSVPLVDVRAAYEAREKAGEPADAFLLDGVHPNDRGHALVAELLLPILREQLR